MRSTTRFFCKAAAAGLLIATAGAIYSAYMHNKTAKLQRSCEATSQRDIARVSAEGAKNPGPWSRYSYAGLVCDPEQLSSDAVSGMVPPGVQGELLSAFRDERNETEKSFYAIAVLILFIGWLPTIWYFFLARLAEIAGAVRRS